MIALVVSILSRAVLDWFKIMYFDFCIYMNQQLPVDTKFQIVENNFLYLVFISLTKR